MSHPTTPTEPDSFELLCALCAANPDPRPLARLTVGHWQALLGAAARHRVLPILSDRLERLDVDVPGDIASRLERHRKGNLLTALKLSAELVDLTMTFQRNDIGFLCCKGLALTYLCGQTPAQRHAGDIDLLLTDTRDMVRVDALLAEAGYRQQTWLRDFATLSVREARLLEHVKHVVYFHPQKGIKLEVHLSLFETDVFPVSVQALHDARTEIPIGATRVPAMSKDDHLLYILAHGADSRWYRLKWLCDVPALSGNGRDYATDAFRRRAERLGLGRLSAQGLCLAHDLLDMPLPAFARDARDSSRLVRELIAIGRGYLAADDIPTEYVLSKRMRHFFVYLPSLRTSRSYKLSVLRYFFTRESDWDVLPLPDRLFWLYYPLRPAMWLLRRIRERRGHG